jgi:hypothetical protein
VNFLFAGNGIPLDMATLAMGQLMQVVPSEPSFDDLSCEKVSGLNLTLPLRSWQSLKMKLILMHLRLLLQPKLTSNKLNMSHFALRSCPVAASCLKKCELIAMTTSNRMKG